MKLFPEHWTSVFITETPILELVTRASVLYFIFLAFFRLMPRRAGGELATMDLVFVFLIIQTASHALGDYSSIADSVIAIASLMTWNYLLNLLSFRFPYFERLLTPSAIQIVRNGQMLRRNMRREFLTEAELMQQLHKQGVEALEDVKAAYIESEGNITVICHEKAR